MIRFGGTLTPEAYGRALAVSGRSMPFVAWGLIAAGVINVCFADLSTPVSWAMPFVLVSFGLMLLISPRMTVARAFAANKLLAEPITGEADEQGVRLETAHGRGDFPWATMHKVVVTPTLVTVYHSAQLGRILPREFFADQQSWDAFRRLAAAAPSAAAPPPRPIRMFLLWIVIIIAVFVVWELFKRF